MAEDGKYGATTDGRQARGRFGPGNSGRPKGALHKTTLAAQAIIDGEAEALTRKAVELALEGDGMALRLVLERLLPSRKERPLSIALPPITSLADASAASAVVLGAVASGELLPSEGAALAQLLEGHRRIMETTELAARVEALEAAAGAKGAGR